MLRYWIVSNNLSYYIRKEEEHARSLGELQNRAQSVIF